jgi:hypothetical protein
MTSNLVARMPSAKMEVKRTFTVAPILRETFRYGDASSVGRALVIPPQRIDDMLAGRRPNPFDQAAIIVEQLRRNGNDASDAGLLALNRRLDYTAFRNTNTIDDARFADLLNEVADVVKTRAAIEAPDSDGGCKRTASELRELARKAYAVAEDATAYASGLLKTAASKESR